MNLAEAKQIFPVICAIYHQPTDLREELEFVVREWFGETPGDVLGSASSLAGARFLANWRAGCNVRLDRDESDDPVIVESWI